MITCCCVIAVIVLNSLMPLHSHNASLIIPLLFQCYLIAINLVLKVQVLFWSYTARPLIRQNVLLQIPLPELRRHKRMFLRMTKSSLSNKVKDSRSAQGMFIEFLKEASLTLWNRICKRCLYTYLKKKNRAIQWDMIYNTIEKKYKYMVTCCD